MSTLGYPVNVEVDEAGFHVVTFPDHGWGATDGETLEEALANAEDALAEIIATYIKQSEDIPVPSRPEKGQYIVYAPLEIQLKAALYQAMREQGIPNTELAKRIQVDEKAVRRLVDPYHKSKVDRIDAALHALGRRPVLSVA